MTIRILLCTLLLALACNVQVFAQDSPDTTLDALHKAGADANPTAFTALLADEVVLLGMDGTGRLEGVAARNFVSERFAGGVAWAYRSSARDIRYSPDGTVAWFDETLENDQLNHGRGTGVLVRDAGGWKVAQYNLTFSPAAAAGSQAAAPAQAQPAQEKKRCMMISHKTNTRASC